MAEERAPAPQQLISASGCSDGARTHSQVCGPGAPPTPQRNNARPIPVSPGVLAQGILFKIRLSLWLVLGEGT